jgi:hypothetical protein
VEHPEFVDFQISESRSGAHTYNANNADLLSPNLKGLIHAFFARTGLEQWFFFHHVFRL